MNDTQGNASVSGGKRGAEPNLRMAMPLQQLSGWAKLGLVMLALILLITAFRIALALPYFDWPGTLCNNGTYSVWGFYSKGKDCMEYTREQWAGRCREIFQREPLNSVIFVMDYVQFTFNGPKISFFDPPSVAIGESVLRWDDVGYRDALCSLIMHHVIETNICNSGDDAIELVFDTSVTVRTLKSDEVELFLFP